MTGSTQSAGRRLGMITIDQAIAGASNVLIAVLAARVLGVASFGLFGIVFLVYVLAQCVARALVCDPLLVHPVEAEERTGEVIGTSCVLGLGLGAALVAIGAVVAAWEARLGEALMVLGACLPLLVLQDLGRYLGFATQRPGAAVVLDVVWLVLLFAGVFGLLAADLRTLPWFVAAWGGTGALAGLLLFAQHPVRAVRPGLAWLRFTWPFSWRYLVSYSATQGAALGASGGVGIIAGARALGGLQGATLLVRPFVTFQVAAISASVGEISRALAGDARPRRHALRASALTTVAAVINAVVLLLLPDGVGEAVLGDSWHAARPLILPTGVQIVFLGAITGVRAGLLGLRAIRKVMVIDVATTVVMLVATIGGAVVSGVQGALWAVATGQAALAVVWWTTFWSHTRDAAPAPVPAEFTPPLPAAVAATPPA